MLRYIYIFDPVVPAAYIHGEYILQVACIEPVLSQLLAICSMNRIS
jgi:hypothetical protein